MATKTRWSEVAREMGTYVRDDGFSVVENFVGHGIGREMHEEPQVPNFVSPQLRAQSRFPPGAGPGDCGRADGQHGHKKTKTLSDHWTQVTADGSYSAHFEHTVAITADGPWVLTAPRSRAKTSTTRCSANCRLARRRPRKRDFRPLRRESVASCRASEAA